MTNGAWWARSRFDHFGANYNQPLGAAPAHFTHNDNIGSPRVALVYKPTEESSVYFSYGTSFNPSAETLSLSASNQALGPERDRTFEVGGKINVMDGLLALTGGRLQHRDDQCPHQRSGQSRPAATGRHGTGERH